MVVCTIIEDQCTIKLEISRIIEQKDRIHHYFMQNITFKIYQSTNNGTLYHYFPILYNGNHREDIIASVKN